MTETVGSQMATKRHKPDEPNPRKFTGAHVPNYLTTDRQCQPRIDAIRKVQIKEQAYYRWRKQHGGMGTDQLKELKRLQKENERLRRAVSDLTLDKLILGEAAKGNF